MWQILAILLRLFVLKLIGFQIFWLSKVIQEKRRAHYIW
jgi:hypothetical protein